VAVGPGDDDAGSAEPLEAGQGGNGAAGDASPAPALAGADASLLALVDRLTAVLERSELGELEVASGGTTIVLRAPSAVERPAAVAIAAQPDAGVATSSLEPATTAGAAPVAPVAPAKPSVKAPLTGIFYAAPSPGATPYVAVGDHVAVGQIIGLIEAMKLFNEIKSDLAGRVARVCVDTGALVKTRQPLIEVEAG
jgi:acetyl-CoA carboxylase biotin carboxyl carrier protein